MDSDGSSWRCETFTLSQMKFVGCRMGKDFQRKIILLMKKLITLMKIQEQAQRGFFLENRKNSCYKPEYQLVQPSW